MLSAEFPKEIAEELINYLIDMEEKDKGFAHLFLAADCYGELRNQSIYVELSQRLLDSLQSLTKLSYRYADTDFKEKTVAKIGAIWQDHRTGWSVLQSIATERNVWYVQDQAVIQLSRIAKIHSEALVYLQEFARQGKSEAIEALATHWRDNPQTLPIIQQLANKGESEAIEALANHWRDDPETLPIIQQQAHKGKSEAIKALVTHWRDNPQTLPIIQQQANKGEYRAIRVLAIHWRDDPETLPIIQQQANKGESEAIVALVTHWRDNPQTLPIIQQLANKAEGEIIGFLTALGRITNDSEIGAIIETILARTDVDAKIKEGFQYFLYYGSISFMQVSNYTCP